MMLGVAFAGCAWSGMLFAQEPAAPAEHDRTKPYVLGAIVVTAHPGQAVAGQTVLSVTSKQIDAKGSRTVDQALDTTPGIRVRTGGDGVPRIFLRGLPPRHTPIFLNGVPLNSAVDGQFDPSLIPTENIADIKVIEGNSSVLYGPGTTGGVIDIITKKGAAGIHGDGRAEGGSGHSYLVSGDVSGAGAAGDFFISGSRASTDGYLLPDGSTRDNSDKQRNNLFFNFGKEAGDWSTGFSGSLFSGHQGIPPSTISASAKDPYAQSQQFERLSAIDGGSGQVDLRYQPAGPFSARTSVYLNKLDETDDRYDNANYNSMSDPTVKTFHQLINSTVDGGQSLLTYDFGRMGSMSAAFGLRREAEHLGGWIRDVALTGGGGGGGGKGGGKGGGTTTYGIRTLDANPALDTYWGALQYEVSPFAKIHVTLGLGENWFDDGVSTRNDGQYMVGLAYDLLPAVQLDASYSRKERYPTLQELFDAQKGNSNLKPERSDDVEAGVRWRPQAGAQVRFSVFQNRIANFIQTDKAIEQYANKDIRVRGFEVASQARVLPNLDIGGSYTYLQTTDQSTGLPVDYRPRDVVQLEAGYRPLKNWAVHAWVNYVADQVVSAKNNPYEQMRMPDYVVANLRLSRLFPKRHGRLYVEADNIFNESYSYAVGLPAPGVMIRGGAQFGF